MFRPRPCHTPLLLQEGQILAMATNPAGYTPRLRPDGNPVQLLKSPLIYLRVVGIVSTDLRACTFL